MYKNCLKYPTNTSFPLSVIRSEIAERILNKYEINTPLDIHIAKVGQNRLDKNETYRDLVQSIRFDDTETVDILLYNGASVNTHNITDIDVFDRFNVDRGEYEITNPLDIDLAKVGRNCLDKNETLGYLIKAGADVNRDLVQSIRFDDTETVEILLNNGASVNTLDTEHGREPLYYATSKVMVDLLITKGANINLMKHPHDEANPLEFHNCFHPGVYERCHEIHKAFLHYGATGVSENYINHDPRYSYHDIPDSEATGKLEIELADISLDVHLERVIFEMI